MHSGIWNIPLPPVSAWASHLELVFWRYPGVLPIVLNEPDLAFHADRWAGLHVAQMMRLLKVL
jgi:hypothetical protein